MTLAQWNTVLDVNLTGMFLCVREAASRGGVKLFIQTPITRAAWGTPEALAALPKLRRIPSSRRAAEP